MNRPALILCLSLLVACTPRGTMTIVPPDSVLGAEQSIFVASTRATDPETGRFTKGRSETTAFARYDIAVPPEREPGEITWPPRGGKPDPRRDFLTTGETIYASDQPFRADLAAALAQDRRGAREATVFIHGYNNTFSEGLYRIAQLSADLELPGVALHYAWPSAATPFGYVYDRDSVTFSRSGLEEMLREVSGAGADRIYLVAHSMGANLVMEVLRQLALRGDTRTLGRIAGIILISPDIDIDVFRSQARDIGKLPQPFLIFGSKQDKVLRLSARLTGQAERLGSLTDVSRVADLDVTLMDVAAFTQGGGHFALGDSAALIKLLGRINDVDAAFGADQAGQIGLLPGVVLSVQNATRIILSPVVAIDNEITR